MEPTFTVAIPAYNASATIAPALRSVLAQTRQDFEIVVVDDGSTDDTADVVATFLADERIAFVRQENRGPAAARNAVLARARGRYLAALDSDDLWLPAYLERMGDALDADPGAAFAYGDAWVLDEQTRRIRRTTAMAALDPPPVAPATPEQLLVELLKRNFVYGSVTMRRSVVQEIGGYDPDVPPAEDYDLWMRLAAHGHRAARVEEICAIYRRQPTTLSMNQPLMLASLRKVYTRFAEELDVGAEARAEARRNLAEVDAFEAMLAGGRPGAALLRRLRHLAGAQGRRLLDRRLWHETPPAEVAAAFPDLRAL